MHANLFDAARGRSLAGVRKFLTKGADLHATNEQGFTALHCAVMACNQPDDIEDPQAVYIAQELIKAGADVNAVSRDGRSVFYLAAEMTHTAAVLQVLVDAGAHPDVSNAQGIHIARNAMAGEAAEFVAQITGKRVPSARGRQAAKVPAAEWKTVLARIDTVFERLNRENLVALQGAGTTQDDAFDDCSQVFQERGGVAAGLTGCAFYTRQDLARAKSAGQLSVGFWGAPEGGDADMLRVGRQVVSAFRDEGFEVEWNETGGMRPTVWLHGLQSVPATTPPRVVISAAPSRKSLWRRLFGSSA
jgi:bifunctional non-homologous end joining protein LigD